MKKINYLVFFILVALNSSASASQLVCTKIIFSNYQTESFTYVADASTGSAVITVFTKAQSDGLETDKDQRQDRFVLTAMSWNSQIDRIALQDKETNEKAELSNLHDTNSNVPVLSLTLGKETDRVKAICRVKPE